MKFSNNSIFASLTEEETAALNGGRRCFPIVKVICRPSVPSFLRPPFSRPVCARRVVYVCY